MSVSNTWLNPFQRSYNQIKSKLIEKLKVQVPEITDFSEGNIFILLISLYAAIAEVLHYYIDNMARETFFVSARRYSSLIKHAKMVDYHVHAGIPSMVDLTISRSDNSTISADLNIPANTQFVDSNGNYWLSTKDITWVKDSYGVNIPLEQKVYKQDVNLGLSPGGNFVVQLSDIDSDSFYVEGSMNLSIGGISWQLVETFGYYGPNDKVYKVELDDDRKPYIQFGDGIHGMIPDSGLSMVASYYITKGSNGFTRAGSINTLPQLITSVVDNAVGTNIYDSVGGSDYENFDQLKTRVPLHMRTLGVAITQQDYEDIVNMIPGVNKSYVHYICGKFLEVYVTPVNGIVAPQSLLDKVYLKLLGKKVITSKITVKPVNSTVINLSANITGKPSFISLDIANQVTKALIDNYNYNTSDIGQPVRLSDLYAIIDNLSMVSYLSITKLFLKPYPSKLGNTLTELNMTHFDLTATRDKYTYTIRYDGSNNFTILDSDDELSKFVLNDLVTITDSTRGNTFVFAVGLPTAGNYAIGSVWSITIIPMGQDQVTDAFLIPIFTKDSIKLNIQETV